MAKKALRVMLQRMAGAEMLIHFADVHQEPADIADDALKYFRSPTEMIEIVLHEVVCRLTELARACRSSPVPQKWIGSSVALGFDSGQLPRRCDPEEELRKNVRVNIFDWGRSELNTLEKHMMLPDKEQHNRAEFWRYYVGGIDRLAWEAARAYHHRFCCTTRWTHVLLTISDFDSMSENDFIGKLTVPLEETTEMAAEICSKAGTSIVGPNGHKAVLHYSMYWREYPNSSRLKGSWCLCIKKACNLPREDMIQLRTTSDPFVEVCAVSENSTGLRVFRQLTSVNVRTLNPEWNESFEFPIASEDRRLEVDIAFPLEKIRGLMKDGEPTNFTRHDVISDANGVEKSFKSWQSHLDLAVHSTCSSPQSSAKASEPKPPGTFCQPVQRSEARMKQVIQQSAINMINDDFKLTYLEEESITMASPRETHQERAPSGSSFDFWSHECFPSCRCSS